MELNSQLQRFFIESISKFSTSRFFHSCYMYKPWIMFSEMSGGYTHFSKLWSTSSKSASSDRDKLFSRNGHMKSVCFTIFSRLLGFYCFFFFFLIIRLSKFFFSPVFQFQVNLASKNTELPVLAKPLLNNPKFIDLIILFQLTILR